MQVDAHQHFWRPARGDYRWLTADAHPTIFRDFEPDDLRPLMAQAGIERTILVQAAPTAEETGFLLRTASEQAFVAGVVGWVDLEAQGAARAIEDLAKSPKLRGLRPMLQDLDDDAWILRPSLKPAIQAMTRSGLRFDALVTPRHLVHLTRFLSEHRDLSVVIDHGAKPDIAHGEIASWRAAIGDIARNSAAFCKLSGLVTEAGPGWSVAQLRPYVEALIEAFGPDRLMWGSDWPVVNEAGGYEAWRAAAQTLTADLDAAARDAIFGETAARFYGITT
jgi:L-fuconolactonase